MAVVEVGRNEIARLIAEGIDDADAIVDVSFPLIRFLSRELCGRDA
jgi:hypothetical protein